MVKVDGGKGFFIYFFRCKQVACQLSDITARFQLNSSNSVPGPAPALVLAGRNRANRKSLNANHLRARGPCNSLSRRGLGLFSAMLTSVSC